VSLVTTIIPVFNRPVMLREAVASVLAQTYRPIEVIIVDDGSTDDTRRVAGDLAREHAEIRVIHQTNGGPGVAREAGRQAATGEFIQLLDSDDLLEPRKFELQVRALEEHPECGIAYGWTRMRFRDGSIHPTPWKRTGERIDTLFPAMLQARWWETTTPLYRASVLRAAGAWLPLRNEEDWELDCRIAATGVRLCQVGAWVSEFRTHDEHLSGSHDKATLRDRAIAHQAIFGHARRAGIGEDAPEMQHFARELFLLSRQCGAAGLAAEAAMLFQLARQGAGARGPRLQFSLYALLARTLGWTTMGKLSASVDRMRS